MSMQPPTPDRSHVRRSKDTPIHDPASGGRNPDGTFAPGNRDAWKHGAYSQRTQRALVESPEAVAALTEHRQEIETDLGGDVSRVKRDLVRRYVETAALADHLGWHLTQGGALTAKGHTRAALSAYLRVLDRQHRLAMALGLDRTARVVADVDRYLDQFAHGEDESCSGTRESNRPSSR